MKMACLTASVSRKAGGLHESVRRLAQSLNNRPGADVRVFSMHDEFTEEDIPRWAPLPTKTFQVYGPWQFGYAPGLTDAMFASNFDILQVHGLWMYPSVAASRWHRRTRRPIIVNPHGMLDPWAVRNSHWKKRVAGALYEHRFLRQASCIRALCQSEADAIRAYGLRSPVCVIPNGIDIPDAPASSPPPWLGKVESGRKVLLYLGRLHPKKGLPNLLQAWKSLQALPQLKEWALAIAGWDQNGHELELKEFVESNNLASSVCFLGPQFGDAKASAYQHADAFVLPSFSEGLPMVVLEAWAYRLPVLITPECNLPEGFQVGAAIRLKTAPEDIAQGVKELVLMAEQDRKGMGQKGHQLVLERFTWNKIAEDLDEVCKWLLEGRERPRCIN
jgi:glycosyltransferase involved in cell wall biosynthesis